MKLYSYEKDGELVFHARKGEALAFARNYSSQTEHVVELIRHETKQGTTTEVMATVAMRNFERSERIAAWRRGRMINWWADGDMDDLEESLAILAADELNEMDIS